MNTNIMIVGGTFDYAGGKESGLVRRLSSALSTHFPNLTTYNGGFVDELHNVILPSTQYEDVVLWMPNVPNDIPKMRDIKSINPHVILVTSKRNDGGKYTFQELINRALQCKSNLVIEFARENDERFKMTVFDPLGNLFYQGCNIADMTICLSHRIIELQNFTRVPSIQIDGCATTPNEEAFCEYARGCSDIFHNLINPDVNVTRFLGNMSFRGDDGLIFVSQRNVDKRNINPDCFVPTYRGENGYVYYYGKNKPSVDTPIQQRLYELFPQINYMLHAHCYINYPGTTVTKRPVPCGALEEVQEIINATMYKGQAAKRLITINLTGHGCLILASSMTELLHISHDAFCGRQMPESMTIV